MLLTPEPTDPPREPWDPPPEPPPPEELPDGEVEGVETEGVDTAGGEAEGVEADGVEADGVDPAGVLTDGTVTDGTVTDGTVTEGTGAEGVETEGVLTVGVGTGPTACAFGSAVSPNPPEVVSSAAVRTAARRTLFRPPPALCDFRLLTRSVSSSLPGYRSTDTRGRAIQSRCDHGLNALLPEEVPPRRTALSRVARRGVP